MVRRKCKSYILTLIGNIEKEYGEILSAVCRQQQEAKGEEEKVAELQK